MVNTCRRGQRVWARLHVESNTWLVRQKRRMSRKCYDVSCKLKAIAVAKEKSKEAAAREYKVDPKRIREWCSQEATLKMLKRKSNSSRKRLVGAGRKPLDENMEDEWMAELRTRNVRVSRRMIREKAKALADPLGTDFKASVGWLRLFMKRKNLSLRRKTSVCQKTPEDAIPKLVTYIMHLRRLQIAHKFAHSNIFAMDETACWMDMVSDTTVDFCGAKSVPLKTSGHEKDHFSVILTGRADGRKLRPYIVFKGKGTRLIKELQKIPGVVVKFSANGWMNDGLMKDYLHSIIGSFLFSKRLLIWDAYKCHISQATRKETDQMKLHTATIPGGCTKFIQAPDVVWNASFKSHLRRSYDTWLSEPSVHEYTKGGNLKPPSRSLLCQWIKEAWNNIPEERIRDSFCNHNQNRR